MISNKEASRLDEPSKWSDNFNDFIACCLQKKPELRKTANELLEVFHML